MHNVIHYIYIYIYIYQKNILRCEDKTTSVSHRLKLLANVFRNL